MRESLTRIGAIIRTEFFFRFRRTTAMITLLAVAATVYLIIPDISTGRTLMHVNSARVLYNSAAVAVGTVVFCTILLSIIGFYIVSNSLRRDILTRTGYILAASPVTSTELIVGKFFGSVLYLTGIMVTYMISAMVMFLIRGESTLEPLVFLSIYVVFVMPVVFFCAAAAIAFESLPLLSGRIGDVVFFFVWAATFSIPVALADHASLSSGIFKSLDVVGMLPIIGKFQEQFHDAAVSIGFTEFDPALKPVLFNGISWTWNLLFQRCSTLLLPVLLLILARIWFHRFDPVRVKSSARNEKRNIFEKLRRLGKPVTRMFQKYTIGGNSFISSIRADVLMTVMLSPFVLVAMVVCIIFSLSVDIVTLRSSILPAIIVVVVIVLSDFTTRDDSSGMQSLLFTAPRIKSRYVVWKFFSALMVTVCFTLIPIMRFVFELPRIAVSLCIGSVLLAAGAVGFGVLTGSRKLFVAIFLMLLYIAMNAKNVPLFDFAGFLGVATTGVQFMYGAMAIGIMVAAYFRHHIRANV